MKKIPTLFNREFEGHRVIKITDEITPGCEEAFLHGDATVKIDGACCAVIDGVFYKRYDAKHGKKPPEGAIPCCEPDPITGHWPHWVKVNENDPGDRWFGVAVKNYAQEFGCEVLPDGTYEAVGKHFNGNPYGLDFDFVLPHGCDVVEVERTFEGIRAYLEERHTEGLVFWLNGEPVCKIKRKDFGFSWPIK